MGTGPVKGAMVGLPHTGFSLRSQNPILRTFSGYFFIDFLSANKKQKVSNVIWVRSLRYLSCYHRDHSKS